MKIKRKNWKKLDTKFKNAAGYATTDFFEMIMTGVPAGGILMYTRNTRVAGS